MYIINFQIEIYLYKKQVHEVYMLKTLKAKFKNGEFSPVTQVNGIEEGETVEIILKKDIKKLEFVGMWKNRNDIKNGLDYVKKIRLWNRFD